MYLTIEIHSDGSYGLNLGDYTVSIESLEPDAIAKGVQVLLDEYPEITPALTQAE